MASTTLAGYPKFYIHWFYRGKRMITWFLNLFKHKHDWQDCRWNRFGIAVEQRCRSCFQHRHHLWANWKRGEIDWQPGQHPNRNRS